MAFSKAHLFDPTDQITSTFAKALSHPVRLDILRTLSSKGACPVDQLFSNYPLAKSTVSQHLEVLRETSLIKYVEEYPHTIYFPDFQTFNLYHKGLQDFCNKFLTK